MSIRGDFGLGLLGNAGPVKAEMILENGLNVFCIVIWAYTFGGQGCNIMV